MQLTYQLRQVDSPDGEAATIAEIEGSIDPTTIEIFDAMFDELLSNDCNRLIIDCGGLRYINSTGLGIIVQYYDKITDNNGGFALMNVSPKISVILEMFGLNEFFPIVGTEEQALNALAGGEISAATVKAELDETGYAITLNAGVSSCGSCGVDLVFAHSGYYVCPRCQALVKYDERDKTTATAAATNISTLEISIPLENSFFKSTVTLVARQGMRAGMSETFAKEIVDNFPNALAVIKTACADSAINNQHLKILAFVSGRKLHIYAHTVGKRIDNDAFESCRTGFDHISVNSTGGGSLVEFKKNL